MQRIVLSVAVIAALSCGIGSGGEGKDSGGKKSTEEKVALDQLPAVVKAAAEKAARADSDTVHTR